MILFVINSSNLTKNYFKKQIKIIKKVRNCLKMLKKEAFIRIKS